jgi:hypothetical protein
VFGVNSRRKKKRLEKEREKSSWWLFYHQRGAEVEMVEEVAVREKEREMLAGRKKLGRELIFGQLWNQISPSLGHEIHFYL